MKVQESLKQYIDLYRSHREEIDAHSAEALNSRRPQALSALEQMGSLPGRRTEGYERTSVTEMLARDYGVNINRVNIPVDVAATFRCDVPNMSTLMGLVINDAFHPAARMPELLPEGVIFTSLRTAAQQYPDLISEYYNRIAPDTDPIVALNTLLVQDGIFIYIPRGLKMAKPLQIVNIFSSPTDMMAIRRVLIIAEPDSEVKVLACDHTQDADRYYQSLQVIEIYAREGSKVDYYDIEESTLRTSRYSTLWARQESGSNLMVGGMTLWSGTTRNDYHIDITGEHCDTMLSGMAIGSDSRHIDNSTDIRHVAPSSRSTQLFKYVLDDESTGAFGGRIYVAPRAIHTESYQSNRNILASTGACIHTKPQLEIYCDDVKCSHGAATGQLDQDALFYMRTRGIPEKEARTMLMQAFMTDVISTIRVESLADRLRHLVEKRFAGADASCADCATDCRRKTTH